MATVLVQFMPASIAPRAEVTERIKASVPHYKDIPGLVRKYYTIADNGACGGFYEFESRAQAEAFFTDAWKDGMQARFGDRPTVTYFESPVIIDNVIGKVVARG
jgi:hypothetical protein